MKTLIKITLAGVAACALSSPAFAFQRIAGVIPPHAPPRPVVLRVIKPSTPVLMRFSFHAPPVNAGVPYAIDFCIGPPRNPCGLPTSHVVSVPAGQTRFADFDSNIFATNILVAAQGTKVPVPYVVEIFP